MSKYLLVSMVTFIRIILCRGFISNVKCPIVSHKAQITSTAINVVSMDVNMIDTLFREAPYIAAFTTCSIKASIADVVAQYYENIENVEIEGSSQDTRLSRTLNSGNGFLDVELFDEENLSKVKRNFLFFLYGGCYQGCLQLFLINTLYPIWFGSGNDLQTVLTKSLFDNFVSGPLICLPLAYAMKGMILNSTVEESLQQCWNEVRYKGLMLKYWAIWIPAQCITFSVIPEHLRILFIAFVAFFWLILLSTVTCKDHTISMVENISAGVDNKLKREGKVAI